MKTLAQIDSKFTNHYKGLLEIQRHIYEHLKNYAFDLEEDEITKAVIQRMESFWLFNVHNCNDLDRQINTVAADFFTETCLLFIKALAKQKGIDVFSERPISNIEHKTKMRPDISFWRNDQLLAVIELKVSDGYKGKHLPSHLEDRKSQIKEIWPDAFFGAVVYWNCFNQKNAIDPNFIGLLNFSKDNRHKPTGKTIDGLLKKLFEAVEK
jgi:hypothetical protein